MRIVCHRTTTSSSLVLALAAIAALASCRPKPSGDAASSAAESSSPAPSASASVLDQLSGSASEVRAAASAIAASGDDATQRAAGPLLVKRVRAMREAGYREAMRPTLVEANSAGKVEATPEQFEWQLRHYQDQDVVSVLKVMGKIGGADIVAYLVEVTRDPHASREVRKAALDALEEAAKNDPQAAAAVADARHELENVPENDDGDHPGKGPVGSVGVGGAVVSGGTVANASAVVAGMAAAFRRCYNKGLQENPDMKGTVRISATIGPTGEVKGVSPSGGGNLSGFVIACVAGRVASAQFASPDTGHATIVIPVSFAPQ